MNGTASSKRYIYVTYIYVAAEEGVEHLTETQSKHRAEKSARM